MDYLKKKERKSFGAYNGKIIDLYVSTFKYGYPYSTRVREHHLHLGGGVTPGLLSSVYRPFPCVEQYS